MAKLADVVQFTAGVHLLDSKFLFASLIWGSVGVGYFVYGKKQEAMIPMIGGLVMVAVSYFVGSWLWMTLTCVGLMIGIYWLLKQGY